MKDFEEIAKVQAQKQKQQTANSIKNIENLAVKTAQPKSAQKTPIYMTWWFWLLVILLASMILKPLFAPANDNEKPSATLSPAELEEKENSYVRTLAQESIKKILKTPKSAEFPIIDEWTFEVGDVSFYKIAHAYVDYENVFGTEVRSYFDVTVRITEEGYQAVRIVFDGETIYEDKITIASDLAYEGNYVQAEDSKD